MYHEISRLRMLTRKRSFAGFTRRAYRLYYRPGDGNVVSSLHCMNDPQPEGHMASHIERRKFLATLGSAAAALPLAARAQQPAQVRRIGVLMPFGEDHPVGQARVAAFMQGLRQLGWTDGHNVRIDYRWSAGDSDNIRKFASELIALGPDVVMAFTSAAVTALRQATSTVPIVFAVVADPVGAGY